MSYTNNLDFFGRKVTRLYMSGTKWGNDEIHICFYIKIIDSVGMKDFHGYILIMSQGSLDYTINGSILTLKLWAEVRNVNEKFLEFNY